MGSFSEITRRDYVDDLLDDEIRLLLAEIELLSPPAAMAQGAAAARRTQRELFRLMHGDARPAEIKLISDERVAGRSGTVPVRVYDPDGDRAAPRDVVISMHGGGWVAGDLDTHDHTARAIAAHLGSRVVSVDYRLAPEHPFPAGLNDCLDVIAAFAQDPATTSISLAGESAGGNLAAAAAISCRDQDGPPIKAQLLIYPALDPSRSEGSVARFAEGFLLTKREMDMYDELYLPEITLRTAPLAVPTTASTLAGLPPAVLVTAGFDLLLDEGREYAKRLVDADVPTVYLKFPTLTHGWLEMTSRVHAAAHARKTTLDAFAAVLNAACPTSIVQRSCRQPGAVPDAGL
jgi:acetyl esterase